VQHFGERAKFISDCVRGLHDEPVKVGAWTASLLRLDTAGNYTNSALECALVEDDMVCGDLYQGATLKRRPKLLVAERSLSKTAYLSPQAVEP